MPAKIDPVIIAREIELGLRYKDGRKKPSAEQTARKFENLKAWRRANPDKQREYEARRNAKKSAWGTNRYFEKRHQLLEMYGGECVACGDNEFCVVQIDHINGGGNKERKASTNYTEKLLQAGKRDDLRCLCAGCNQRARAYGPDIATWPCYEKLQALKAWRKGVA